ncbi:MAG: hypothetical protein QF464_06485, partial [Myxococcota bacterium]|nr:hypothetical protein [Myxococcota bacterium]
MSTWTPAEIADRDARRFVAVLEEIGGEGAPLGGGWMSCDRPGSWANHAAGLGLRGPVDSADLDALIAFYVARGRTPQIQLTPYQHPTLLGGLEARGFVPYHEQTVLVRDLTDLPADVPVSSLEFRAVDPSDDASVAA